MCCQMTHGNDRIYAVMICAATIYQGVPEPHRSTGSSPAGESLLYDVLCVC